MDPAQSKRLLKIVLKIANSPKIIFENIIGLEDRLLVMVCSFYYRCVAICDYDTFLT